MTTEIPMINYQFDMKNLNVIDELKGKTVEEIKEILNQRRSHFVVCFEAVRGDFNSACALRNLNAFAGESMILLGRRQWDSRGAVGVQHYENLIRTPDYSILQEYRERGYRIIAAENDLNYNPISLRNYEWPEKVVVCFGEEGAGLTSKIMDIADDHVCCPMRGSVRSFNVGTMSGIFLFHYSMQRGYLNG